MGSVNLKLEVNGHEVECEIDARTTLLDFLRERLSLTGCKKGCDHGQCGACTVLLDGRRTLSCLRFAASLEGRSITTIEGIGTPDALHPLQKAFVVHDALQCGFCTCGQIMSALELLADPSVKTADDVRELMSGNLCRCGAYAGIIAAILDVKTNAAV